MSINSLDVRKKILETANACKRSAHVGGSLSMVEILTVLYRDILNYKADNPLWEDRDRFILSKGHCVLGLFVVLSKCGFISEEELATFLQDESQFGSHPVMDLEHGIESSNGSLGQGLSMALGMAKAAKIKGRNYNVYVLAGNGECNEGAIWESAMLAAQWNLNNLTLIVDNNKLQSDGESNGIIGCTDYAKMFEAAGCFVIDVDGHSEDELLNAYKCDSGNKPKVIIANTIKGKGVPFMENNNEWHHNRLTDEIYKKALDEMEGLK